MEYSAEKVKKYAFGVCRIEPENNLHVILEAFAGNGALPLVVVGNWERCDYGRNLKKEYGEKENISLLDPIYDLEKLDALRAHCTLYLHGHSCGGTNPSLVEAMYLGLPVAAFDVNFNRETTENKAFYFKDAAQLREIVASATDDALRLCAGAMREIAVRRYTWKRIADLYAEIL